MKFRKKPVEIEAIQYTSNNGHLIVSWSRGVVEFSEIPNSLHVSTPEGVMTARKGDWIIKGVAGEFYPCKPEIFAATYEPVPEPVQP